VLLIQSTGGLCVHFEESRAEAGPRLYQEKLASSAAPGSTPGAYGRDTILQGHVPGLVIAMSSSVQPVNPIRHCLVEHLQECVVP
jgi:hypothetical protein